MRGPNSTKIATFRKPKNFALRGLKNYQFLLLPHSQERANLSDFSSFAGGITPAKLKIGTLRPYYVKKFCTKFQQNPTRLRSLSNKTFSRSWKALFFEFLRKKSYYIFGESSPWEALSRKSGLTKRRFRRDMAERNLKIAVFGRMFRAKYERFPRFFRHRVQDLNVISPPVKKKSRLASIRPISSSSIFTKKLFYLQEREKLLFETLRPISILLSCLGRGQFFSSPEYLTMMEQMFTQYNIPIPNQALPQAFGFHA